MKWYAVFTIVVLCVASASSETCKITEDFSPFNDVRDSVQRVIQKGIMTGWDDKRLSRSGDMSALAIVKAIPDKELVSPDKVPLVLDVLRTSFACLSRCVESCSDRQPRITLLLLDHLRDNSSGDLRMQVEEMRKYILQQSIGVWLDSPVR